MATSRPLIGAVLVAAATVAAFACTSLDDLSSEEASGDGGTEAAIDAGADAVLPDGALPDDAASDPCKPTPGNILAGQNEDFEIGCGLWGADRVSLSATATARCGKQACKVCPFYDDSGGTYLVPSVAVHPGERYVLSVTLRREGESSSIAAAASLHVKDTNAVQVGAVPLMTDWSVSTVSIDVPADGEGKDLELGVQIATAKGGADCFLLDEAALVRTKDAGL